MKISIIGTAGRKDAIRQLSAQVFLKMLLDAEEIIKKYPITTLVSGGAAWADHIVVDLFLRNKIRKLELYLPADFKNEKFVENGFKSAGSIANYYHRKFSMKSGRNSLKEISLTQFKGAKIFIFNGFHQRNIEVAKSDIILAYTFSSTDIPDDGGTLHTWNQSQSKIKIHRRIQDL